MSIPTDKIKRMVRKGIRGICVFLMFVSMWVIADLCHTMIHYRHLQPSVSIPTLVILVIVLFGSHSIYQKYK